MRREFTVGPAPIESIRLVAKFSWRRSDHTYTATSLPGHLIHLVINGKAEQTSNGLRQLLVPGTVVWYHENEWVTGHVIEAPWTFYSINFDAPALSPPPFNKRLLPGRQRLFPLFEALLAAWRQNISLRRACICQAHLLKLIAAVYDDSSSPPPPQAGSGIWWEAEEWARRQIDRPLTLADLCARTRRSPNTIARACHAAVGMPPMKRLKQIRLSLAQGLVRFSNLTMTEIALRVGYARVHEFSRDYRKAFGKPPTDERD